MVRKGLVTTLLTMSALSLTACGGGGGSSSSGNTVVNFTVTATAGSGGSITPGSRSVPSGQTTTFTLAANSGFRVDQVTGCGGSLNGNIYTTANITANCAVQASFIPDTTAEDLVILSTTVSGEGTVTPNTQQVAKGETLILNLSPAAGFRIGSVSGCGGVLNSNQYTTGPLNENCTVSIDFISVTAWIAGEFLPESTFKDFCQIPRTGIDPFTRQPYPDKAGTSMHEKMWLRSWTNNTYLWYREVPDNNPANFSVLAFFDQLKTTQLTDSGSAKDNFHFSENTAEYQQSTQAGVSAGYGIRWSFGRNTPPRSLTIAYTEPASPAANAGLTRGDRLVSINGVDFVNDNTETGVNLLNNALFPSATGQSFNFVFESVSGQRKAVTMASANVSSSPVQNVKVLNTEAGKVGYMQFNTHIALAQPQLISAVNQFADENINELVIDLRYNGGGLLALASQLGYMVTGPNIIQGRIFERTIFNDKYPDTNPVTNNPLSPIPFYSREINYETGSFAPNNLPSLNLNRVFILSTANTCSASEAFINALRGIDVEVVLVGGQTCGKPYGFYPTDNCGTTYFTVQFTGVNAKGFGEYSDGFVPKSNPVFAADVKGCPLPDDFSKPLGDADERLLSAAIFYAKNGSCPTVSVASAGAGGFVLPYVDSRLDASAEGQMRLLDPRYQDILFNSKLVTEIKALEEAQ